jgi:DNA-binding PadR family transcriptional regulator
MELSNATYLILGMLRLGARSGYDIKRLADRSARYFAAVSQIQIYPALRELESHGLVKGRSDPRGRRPRRVYELTRAGERELVEWLRREEDLALDVRDLGLLKVFLSDALDGDGKLELVRRMRARSERIVNELRRTEPDVAARRERGQEAPLQALGFGLAMHEAWIAHCDALERELTSGRGRRRAG